MTDRPPGPALSEPARFFKSFGWAWRGIVALVRTQANARFHLVATIVVVAAGFGFSLSREEWLFVVLSIGAVWTAEGVNTAIEAVVDLVSPEHHPLAGRAKDVAAGAVLLAAIMAAVIGLLVFGPHLLAMVKR